MNEYHKIQTVFKRDMENGGKKLLPGQWTRPEFDYLSGNLWICTEKVDGTNIRIKFDGNRVTFAGRTDNAHLPAKLVDRLNVRFGDPQKMQNVFGNTPVCLYGEGYGEGIQKGGCYRKDQDFVLFDVFIEGIWLERHNVEDIAKRLGLDVVPIYYVMNLREAISATARGIGSQYGEFQAEGLVCRPKCEMLDRRGQRIITKIKCRDFQ